MKNKEKEMVKINGYIYDKQGHAFKIVDTLSGLGDYEVWCINMVDDGEGYIPLCKTYGNYNVDTSSLCCIKSSNAAGAVKAACIYGQNFKKFKDWKDLRLDVDKYKVFTYWRDHVRDFFDAILDANYFFTIYPIEKNPPWVDEE